MQSKDAKNMHKMNPRIYRDRVPQGGGGQMAKILKERGVLKINFDNFQYLINTLNCKLWQQQILDNLLE